MTPDAIAQIYASDVVSGFDIYKPEKLNELFMRYGDQGASYFQLVRSLGFEKPVALDTYGHYEDMRVHEVCRSLGIVAQPAINADIVFTLDPDSLDANNNFYVRMYDQLLFKNEVVGVVTDIDVSTPTAPDITVEIVNTGDRFPALVADEQIIIISNEFSEGSGQPEGALSGAWEYDNDAQIIKETIGVTGSEMVNQDWFNVTSKGQKIPAFYFKGQTEIDYRTALRIDGALLFSKRTTQTITDADTGRPLKSTEGLIPYIRRLGYTHPYTVGSYDVSDFDTMNLYLDQQHVGNFALNLLGIKLHFEVEDVLVDYFKDTNINFTRQVVNDAIFYGNESLGTSVNFKYMTKGERTFMFKRLGNFNNPKTYGAEGYDMPNMGVVMPLNKKKDPVSKSMVESIGVRYRGLGKYSRRMEVWSVGGAGEGLKVTEFDKKETYQRCHIGAHFRGGNQFILIDPS